MLSHHFLQRFKITASVMFLFIVFEAFVPQEPSWGVENNFKFCIKFSCVNPVTANDICWHESNHDGVLRFVSPDQSCRLKSIEMEVCSGDVSLNIIDV